MSKYVKSINDLVDILKDIDVVIFDHDGVIHSLELEYETMKRMYKCYGKNLDKDIGYNRYFGLSQKDYILLTQNILVDNLSKDSDKLFTNEIDETFKHKMLENYSRIEKQLLLQLDGVDVFDYVKPLLKSLKRSGKHLYILSSNIERYVLDDLQRYNIRDYFDKVICTNEPKSTYLENTLKYFGVDKSKCAMIDDYPKNIIEIKNAGLALAIYIHHDFNDSDCNLADYVTSTDDLSKNM